MNAHDVFSWWEYDLSENYSKTEQLICSVKIIWCNVCLVKLSYDFALD